MVFGKFLDKSIRSVKEKKNEISNFFNNFLLDGTDSYSAVAFVLAILFVAISNVLLLNVLVALFKYGEKNHYFVIHVNLFDFSF